MKIRPVKYTSASAYATVIWTEPDFQSFDVYGRMSSRMTMTRPMNANTAVRIPNPLAAEEPLRRQSAINRTKSAARATIA